MTKKDLVYQKLLQLNLSDGIDTQTLSTLINMSRANLSHELNELCKEGKLFKSSTRPVLFFLSENKVTSKKSQLDLLAEHNVSLKDCVEQAKAAILYPPKGMNCLILGSTGVGKSMFASLMHNYAVEMNVKSADSPFIVFNCADYSNNPQLLTSQLFGVKKGAYTGAEADKTGLIEQADGGILFLDEIHRLPPEGQEALFVFLDSGTFRRIGDSETRKSDVLIISATTEDPNSALLNTFTRRIPIVINIPSLKDRTLDERLFLIKNFFKHESIRINKDIYASLNSLRALLSYDCPNNIGQLKSDVQLLCAKAYSEFLTNVKKDVRIHSKILPPYIKEGLYKEKEHRVLWNKLMSEEIEYFRFNGSNEDTNTIFNNSDNTIYDFIENKLEKLKSLDISNIDIENILEKDIAKHFNKNNSEVPKEINRQNLLTIIDESTLGCLDEIITHITKRLPIIFDNNLYTAFALHINTLINRIKSDKIIINTNLNKIKELYPAEFAIALEVKELIENHISKSIPIDEAGYLTLFLIPDNTFNDVSQDKVKVILIAHGESTATSMADVAGKLLGEDYVIPINAPVDVAPSKVLESLKICIQDNPTSAGYLLLVDMGSLTTFADVIKKEFNVDIKVISLVSTLHVLEATRKALIGSSLDDIYNDVLMVNSYVEIHKNINNVSENQDKILIITACLTGEGAAIAIKNFLLSNLRLNSDYFEIVCLNCLDKNYFKQKIINLQKHNEILFIVSSFPVNSPIKQYAMYEVFNMDVLKELQAAIDSKNTMLNLPKIIKENIYNIDGAELFKDVTNLLNTLQEKLSIKLSDENTVGIILHLSFVVGRLRNDDNPAVYPNKDAFIKENINLYNIVRENLNFINIKYNINIIDDEICYLMNLLLNTEPTLADKLK
ncbi:PTS system transcriptional activator [Clostridium sp. DL-VIII]|uniref:sigma-54-dependent transcriptional regulator n=1 Tax=Clostridium sp. DL-VIII TaxID=641107 RepID=UPI00023B06B4|nr:sigma-54-dependent transcriptional regulator [Clostridium sp. DL-VIII]EHJ02078.1 PTS system transcriptional activator [Clostridium sp. DL-VIII]